MIIREIRRFIDEEDGATAIGYGIIVAMISIVIVGAAESMGDSLGAFWGDTSTKMSNAVNGPAP